MYVAFSHKPRKLAACVVVDWEIEEDREIVALGSGSFWICGLGRCRANLSINQELEDWLWAEFHVEYLHLLVGMVLKDEEEEG